MLDTDDYGPAFIGLCQDTQKITIDDPTAFYVRHLHSILRPRPYGTPVIGIHSETFTWVPGDAAWDVGVPEVTYATTLHKEGGQPEWEHGIVPDQARAKRPHKAEI